MASSRSLEEWLAYQSQVHPQAIELGLERLRSVLERLHWRQPAVPVITVAGTNGKGSVTAFCGAILAAAGYRVGAFTSPHLRDYRERIRVNDEWASADELVQAFERIETACRMSDPISLTFFEYNALAAFLIFEAAKAEVWILEVGMGGRLDAVNVVDPSVAAVVSIGLDHQEFLGTTLESIAREKAGVFRNGRTAVLGSRDLPPALHAIAESMGARPKRLGVEFDYVHDAGGSPRRCAWRYRGSRWNITDLPPPALAGETQFGNAATAIALLEELELPVPLSPSAVAQGLESVRLPGRFQSIAAGAGRPEWILDVAHNPAAARVLAENLRRWRGTGISLAVCGILADKDAAGIAAELRDDFAAWWLVSTEGARGTGAAALAARMAGELNAPLAMADDVAAGCAAALGAAAAEDRIVVFGSFHTVGPALEWLDAHGLLPPSAVPEYTRWSLKQ